MLLPYTTVKKLLIQYLYSTFLYIEIWNIRHFVYNTITVQYTIEYNTLDTLGYFTVLYLLIQYIHYEI